MARFEGINNWSPFYLHAILVVWLDIAALAGLLDWEYADLIPEKPSRRQLGISTNPVFYTADYKPIQHPHRRLRRIL